jgi:hypothetical protein
LRNQICKDGGIVLISWLALWGLLCVVWPAPVLTGSLAGPDDYMRMVRVFSILDGNAGHYFQAPRLGIDGLAQIPWSRLVDAPLVLIQFLLEKIFPRYQAANLTVTIIPGLALFALMASTFLAMRPFVSRPRGIILLLSLLLVWGALRQFIPGRVDHHMWQIVLTVLSLGALFRIYLQPELKRGALQLGFYLSTGLAIGADIIPALTLFTISLGTFWLLYPSKYERSLFYYGAALFVFSGNYHLIINGFDGIERQFCDALSLPWLFLSLCVFVFSATVFMASAFLREKIVLRLFVSAGLGCILLSALYVLFPSCFTNFYGVSNPQFKTLWLAHVIEARSLLSLWGTNKILVLFFVIPFLTAMLSCVWLYRNIHEHRLIWVNLLVILTGAFALCFYQVRVADFMLSVCLVITYCALELFYSRHRESKAPFAPSSVRKTAAIIFFIIGLCLAVLSVAYKPDTRNQSSGQACNIQKPAELLNEFDKELVIVAEVDFGSELLFRTKHKVLSAPYHRNQAGVMAAYRILHESSTETSLEIMLETGADLVLVCKSHLKYYRAGSLGYELIKGKRPFWLVQANAKHGSGNFLIFQLSEKKT